jgi:uncharacterized protein involved in exopolysaccharide biosynthesis
MDFKFYFLLFLRRLHWFMLFLIIGSAIGLTLAKILPPVYVAQARLLVESEQIPDNLAASTVRTGAVEQLQIIQQRILTRETLIDTANRLNIYAAQPDARPRIDADSIVRDMRDRISIDTSGGAGRGATQARLVSVRFEAPNAQMAATVTNELVTLILREDVSMRTGVARQTLEFFEQEVSRLDNELASQGAEILAFKQANKEALPDSLEFRRSQQAGNQERLLQLERSETALLDRRDRMVSLYETMGEQSVGTGGNDTEEKRQLASLKNELSTQLSVLSPQNPRIKLLQARIAAYQEIVDKQIQASTVVEGGEQLSPHEAELAELNGQLDFIADQKAQVNAQLAELKASIEATPSNAITLGTLERDYANTRVQYDQAVANKARAQTGDIIEALSKGQRISVIEQAVVPRTPEKPDRPLIAAAGVGGGMVLGLAVVVLLELLNRGIRRPVDLTNRLGITPLATLPYYRTTADLARRRILILSILGAFLIGIPIALWAINAYVIPLDRLLDRLANQVGLAEVSVISTIGLA